MTEQYESMGSGDSANLDEMADRTNESDAYEAGYQDGYRKGYTAGQRNEGDDPNDPSNATDESQRVALAEIQGNDSIVVSNDPKDNADTAAREQAIERNTDGNPLT